MTPIRRFIQRWRDRRAVRRWILSAGADPIRNLTVGEQHELMELLAKLANEETPELAEAEPGDPPPAGSSHEEELDRGGYWLKPWDGWYEIR